MAKGAPPLSANIPGSRGLRCARSSYDLMYDGRFQLDGRQCDWTRTLSIRPRGPPSNLDRGRYPVVSFSILLFFIIILFFVFCFLFFCFCFSCTRSSAVRVLFTHSTYSTKIGPGNRSFVLTIQPGKEEERKELTGIQGTHGKHTTGTCI